MASLQFPLTLRVDAFDEMFAIVSRDELLRPILYHLCYLAIANLEEGNNASDLHAITYGYVAHRFIVGSHQPIDREGPSSVRRILFVHRGKIIPASDPFTGLRPLQHKIIR